MCVRSEANAYQHTFNDLNITDKRRRARHSSKTALIVALIEVKSDR